MRLNPAAIHLMINTLPPVVSVLALLAMAFGVVFRSELLKRQGIGLVVAVPLLIIPVFYTGHAAVTVVGNIPGVPLELIGEHQDSVTATWTVTAAAGAAALAGLITFRRRTATPAWFTGAMILLCCAGVALLLRTAHLGGLIRHSEARLAAPSAHGRS